MAEQKQRFDLVVIGAGPAGLSAAIYGSWLGLKTVVLESGIIGGRAWLAPQLENYPGFEFGIKGSDLVERMRLQALRFRAEIQDNEEVIGLDLKGEVKRVVTRKQTYETAAIIIATGTQRRKLHVPGETELLGRGVSYCVTCDGPLFKRATVAIVGNGEEAAIDALFMSDLASHVLLVTNEREVDISGALMDRLQKKANVQVLKAQLQKIIGQQTVDAVRILDYASEQEQEHQVRGVFVSLGGVPLTAIVQNAGITTERTGCLAVDRQQKTNIEGVYAAGDCTCGGMQVVTATGEGAMAAMRASAYVRKTSKG